MWTGIVARTERNGDRLDIIIHYTNGNNEYDQTVSTTSIQDPNWITDQITAKLNQLNSLDVFEQQINKTSIISSELTIDTKGALIQNILPASQNIIS